MQCRRPRFDTWVRKIPWRSKRQPTPVSLPGKFHGRRSLAGYSPWGRKESDTTERLTHTYTHTPSECDQGRAGLPYSAQSLTHGREALSWAGCYESTGALTMLIPAHNVADPHQRRAEWMPQVAAFPLPQTAQQ